MIDILFLKGMCSESHDFFKFCEMSVHISLAVQHTDIVAMQQ